MIWNDLDSILENTTENCRIASNCTLVLLHLAVQECRGCCAPMLLRVKNFAEENDRPRSRGASRSNERAARAERAAEVGPQWQGGGVPRSVRGQLIILKNVSAAMRELLAPHWARLRAAAIQQHMLDVSSNARRLRDRRDLSTRAREEKVAEVDAEAACVHCGQNAPRSSVPSGNGFCRTCRLVRGCWNHAEERSCED